MSGTEYDDFDDDDYGDDSSVLKTLRKENRAKEKEIKALREQLDSLASQSRERNVKDVLASKGLNEKIAKFIPADHESEEDILAWVDANADIFGLAPAQEQDAAPEQAGSDVSGFVQNSQLQSTGSAYSGDPDQMAALIANARTPEELNQVLFGSKDGPSAY